MVKRVYRIGFKKGEAYPILGPAEVAGSRTSGARAREAARMDLPICELPDCESEGVAPLGLPGPLLNGNAYPGETLVYRYYNET